MVAMPWIGVLGEYDMGTVYLTKENWASWSNLTYQYLNAHGLWQIVAYGLERNDEKHLVLNNLSELHWPSLLPPPTASADENNNGGAFEGPLEVTKENLRLDELARDFICETLSAELMDLYHDTDTAQELWNRLHIACNMPVMSESETATMVPALMSFIEAVLAMLD